MATVLLLSYPEDDAASMVADRLRSYSVTVARCNPGDFPMRAELAAFPGHASRGVLRTADTAVDLAEVVGVLYRRPSQFAFPDDMTDEHRKFARAEARHGLGGVLTSLPARWINHPSAIADTHFKPRQLDIAADVGMTVPRTLITNSPKQARAFAEAVDRPLIYKPFEPPILSDSQVIFTSVVNPADLDDPALQLTAHLFQEQIPKVFDARITVVGTDCFGVAIHSHSAAARVDFRADYGAVTYSRLELPTALPRQLRAYLDHFGLVFGAFDFAVTDGAYYFLECNPNGQWGWLEEETGLPMAEAFARYLVEG